MDCIKYKSSFDTFMGARSKPNAHEKKLFARAEKYIHKITWIPGIRLIAIVNSLSMYATHEDSDIDLFIVTAKNRIWLVRILMTLTFWLYGVWRHGEDIAGNFCLSFFVEEDAMDMASLAIEDDIYLFFWMYYMRPVWTDSEGWDSFQEVNPQYTFLEKSTKDASTVSVSTRDYPYISRLLDPLDALLGYFGEKRALSTWKKKGSPEGVIIRKNILKFHDTDKRGYIRDQILSLSSRD